MPTALRRSLPHSVIAWTLLVSIVLDSRLAGADDAKNTQATASDLLPDSTVAYVEVSDLSKIVDTVLEHPLRKRVESMPAFEAFEKSGQYTKFLAGVGFIEGLMAASWEETLAGLTDGGVVFAFDAASKGPVLLIKSSDEEKLARLINFVESTRKNRDDDGEAEPKSEYRGYPVYALDDGQKLAIVEQWLLMTNRPELGKSIIDRILDGSTKTLSNSESFQEASQQRGDHSVFAYFDVKTVRDAGVAPALYSGKTENIVAEVLFGAIAATLSQTPYATATADVEPSGVSIVVSTPHQSEWTSGREYFVGDGQPVTAPPLIELPERLFATSIYRDLSQMWLLAPDLMNEKANEELAKADTNLTTFFSGRDFGEDILGSLHPEIQFVVTRQSFQESQPIPAIKLPEFALQMHMRDPEATTKEFRRVFQSLIGFINIVGAMQGQPQFDMDFRTTDGSSQIVASYVPPNEEDELRKAPINYNFSPTIAFAGDRLLLGSTGSVVDKLLGDTVDSGRTQDGVNTAAILKSDPLVAVLGDNRAQLVAQNMVEKGHGPDEAEAEIGVVFEILELLSDLSLQLEVSDNQMRLSTELRVDQR